MVNYSFVGLFRLSIPPRAGLLGGNMDVRHLKMVPSCCSDHLVSSASLVPGCYALSVNGELPADEVQTLSSVSFPFF